MEDRIPTSDYTRDEQIKELFSGIEILARAIIDLKESGDINPKIITQLKVIRDEV